MIARVAVLFLLGTHLTMSFAFTTTSFARPTTSGLPSSRRRLAERRSSLGIPGKSNGGDEDEPEKEATVLDAVSIIAGTSIGGGFLALPFATSPAGFLPSSVGLVACWSFLLGCGLAFADATVNRLSSEQDPDSADISVFSVAESAGGSLFGAGAGLLFAVRCVCTLGAQDSKAGDLVSMALVGSGVSSVPYAVAVAVPAVVAGVLTFKLRPRVLDRLNTALTFGLLLSFAALVGCGVQQGLDMDLLRRSDWSALVPHFAGSSSSVEVGAAGLKWCIPVFLQLLCFMEVVPVVCARLGPQRPKEIQSAVVLGSFVPLLMCLAWSCVAIGLVPYDPLLASDVANDPINVLLRSGLPIRVPVTCVAAGSIVTTLFGTYLTCAVFTSDLACKLRGLCEESDRLVGRMATVALPIVLALGGPEVFYTLTAFAGSILYVLWGLVPAISALALNRQQGGSGSDADDKDVVVGGGSGAGTSFFLAKVQSNSTDIGALAKSTGELERLSQDGERDPFSLLPGGEASLVAIIGVACGLLVTNTRIQLGL